MRNAQSALDTEKKAYLDAKKRSEELTPRDPNRKRTVFEVYELEKKVKRLEEKVLYQELLVKKRLEYVKQVYPKRYQQKLAWPDQAEVQLYQTNKRLNRASRNWSERVPKLQDRIKSASDVAKDTEKPTAESSAAH
ncbi:MAG: hypothetical protein NDI61_07115 [Bdellovibrionaceae bacterium]|nr:hypothetical protein [Pseudobdellovibrionaceae bacterium]